MDTVQDEVQKLLQYSVYNVVSLDCMWTQYKMKYKKLLQYSVYNVFFLHCMWTQYKMKYRNCCSTVCIT